MENEMAYCRGEVYAYRCGEGRYSIHVGSKDIDEAHESYAISGIVSFSEKLHELKARGLEVPNRVFERINREISEGRR